MLTRSPLFWIGVGFVLCWGYCRWRGVLDGPPWAPAIPQRGPRAAAA